MMSSLILFDMPSPHFQVMGAIGGVAFGLFLSAISIALFLWFRKSLSVAKGVLIGGLLILAIVGGLLIWIATVLIDNQTDRERNLQRQQQLNERMQKEIRDEREENKNSSNTNTTPQNTTSPNKKTVD